MAKNWSPRCYQSSAKVFAFVILFIGNVAITPAAEPNSTGSDQQKPGYTGDFEPGYPEEERPAGVISDAEEDLDESFPQPGSILPGLTAPRSWGIWQAKRDLYDQIGLKLGFSYQMLYQHASTTAPFANFDDALGQWWGVTAKWTMFNRGQDFEGSLVFTANDRNSVGDNAVPAQYGSSDLGSSWSNFEFTEWDLSVEDLYWEQWLKQDRFVLRLGNQIPTTIYNSFRFKDGRTSFTSSPFAFHESIPYPTYGLGVAFKAWPIEDSEFYVTGTLNDMNGNPNERHLDWNTFGRGEYFYGLEFGYNWRRENGEFDHLHLDVFYADERSTRSPNTLPNEAGGGFKVLGSKQVGPYVGFGSYTYNTAEGGGISVTFAEHTVTAGAAYLNPLGIQGEATFGLMWMKTHDNLKIGPLSLDSQNQYGAEAYWKMLLTPNIWVTPGVQFVIDPAFNPDDDFIVIPHVKFRLFL